MRLGAAQCSYNLSRHLWAISLTPGARGQSDTILCFSIACIECWLQLFFESYIGLLLFVTEHCSVYRVIGLGHVPA